MMCRVVKAFNGPGYAPLAALDRDYERRRPATDRGALAYVTPVESAATVWITLAHRRWREVRSGNRASCERQKFGLSTKFPASMPVAFSSIGWRTARPSGRSVAQEETKCR